jgi:hypothetical protein
VRSRHADLVGDFGRSARQQQVLSALKLKLNGPGIIGKLPEIAHDLDGFVKTDMQLTDVLKLVNFARGLDASKIDRVILGPPYSQTGNLPNGTSVVFPNCSLIVPVIAKMFALGDKAACNIQANSGSSSQLASAGTGSPLASSTNAGSSSQMMSSLATLNEVNMPGGSNDLTSIHSLLDLMLMTVFESPEAIQA